MRVRLWVLHFQAMDDPRSSVRNLSVTYRTRVHRFILPIPAASWALTIPGLSEAMIGLRTFLKTRLLLETTSGIQIIDVRDLAKAHLGLLERGGPPARYLMGGNYYSWTDYAGVMEEVTSQKFRRVRVRPRILKAAGAIGDVLSRFVTMELPLSQESVTYATEWAIADDSLIKKTLDLRVSGYGRNTA